MQPTNGLGWFLAALKRYTDFKGRSRRREFWYSLLFFYISYFIAEVFGGLIGFRSLFGLIVCLTLAVPVTAAGVRRLHDTNRSGWWYLLPIVNFVFWAQDSDLSENQYGPSPKSADQLQTGASANSSISMSNLDQLERLATLRDKGVLTEDEFRTKKAALL